MMYKPKTSTLRSIYFLLSLIAFSFGAVHSTSHSPTNIIIYKYDETNYHDKLVNLASNPSYSFPSATINTALAFPKAPNFNRFGLGCKCREPLQPSTTCPIRESCIQVQSNETNMAVLYNAIVGRPGPTLMINVAFSLPVSTESNPQVGLFYLGKSKHTVPLELRDPLFQCVIVGDNYMSCEDKSNDGNYTVRFPSSLRDSTSILNVFLFLFFLL